MKLKLNKILCLVFALCVIGGQSAFAQFTASGTVVDEDNLPLIGVSIIVQGTLLGTVTDFDGKFTLECPNQEAILEFSYVGYASLDQQFTASLGETVITMPDAITQLDEVVVTGLATTVKRSNLANSVARIGSAELTGVTQQPTMDAAMYGKFTGAEIKSNSGAPGGGMSIRLRGVTSIFGDQQPMYIMDGIILDNSAITLGTNIVTKANSGGSTDNNQDDASNRIADIDPEDIESIEILKGASAAAQYGSRAAGGVVIITTKRGKPGESGVSFSQTFGMSSPTQLLGTRGWSEQKVRDVYGEDEAQRYLTNGETDYEKELYDRQAFATTSRLEVYGGNEQTQYMLGGTYMKNDGIVDRTGYEKASFRLNLGHKFTDWFDISATSNYINSTADRGVFNNGNGNVTVGYALAFTRPWDDLHPDSEGNYPANPRVGSNVLETVAKTTNREEVSRFIGGSKATFKILTTSKHSLKAAGFIGLDKYTLRTTSIFPQELTYYQDPTSLGGVSIQGNTVNSVRTLEAAIVHSWYMDNFSLRTQVGVQQIDVDLNTTISTATGLNGSQTNLDQAASVAVYQNIQPQRDKGFFAQMEGNWDDKLIATIGVRGDKSSNNGDANQLYYYPKANAAVNLHEFDFWNSGFVNNLKFRVAYGEAGRFANFDNRFNAYDGTLIQLNSGLETNILRGNTEVGPERQKEIEFGLDVGFWENRVGLDYTYYIKTIEDLLLEAQVPTSTGFTRQVVNAGELQNNGMEIGLTVNPVRKENFNWFTRLGFWTNDSEITRLDIPAFNLGGFAASLGQYRIQKGKSATQIVGTFNTDDCETGDCSDLDPDGDGFRVYGNAEPDFNLTWSNEFSLYRFSLSFLLHYKGGGHGINLSTFLYDLSGTTWDYDDTNLDPTGTEGNGDYRLGVTGASPWIEKTSYLKLREIGLYYTFPRSSLNDNASIKIGFSGRNLINIFDYNSYDPEVSNFGGNVLANAVEVTPYPYAKTFNFHFNVTF